MSRRHQLMRTPLRWAALVVVSGFATLTLSSCGAGQITQTDTQVAAVDGANQDAGDIALRDVLLPYPENGAGAYPEGSDVPLQATIVNDGNAPDTLIAVRTPAATRVLVQGRTTIPPGTSIVSVVEGRHDSTSESASATASSVPGPSVGAQAPNDQSSTAAAPGEPSTEPGQASGGEALSPLDVGELRIVLIDTTRVLRAGLNTPITFVFRNAGPVTLPVPIGAPQDAGREPLKRSGDHS